MTFKIAVRFLALAFLLSACGEVAHESPFDPKSPLLKQARGEVSGRATLENEVDHSQITVVLFNGARRYEASTDKAGDYLFQGVVPGTYQIIANARYFQERKISVVVPLGERVEAERLALPSLRAVLTGNALAQVLIDRTFKTEGGVLLKLQRKTSIRGAAPAPAYQTMASEVTLPAIAFQTVSDGEGSWQMAGVPVGRYELTASFDTIPPITVNDIVVTGDGEVAIEPLLLIPLTGFFDIIGMQDGRRSADFTTNQTVTLRLTGSGAVQRMRLGYTENNDCVYPATPPILYQAEYPHALTAEGINTVCVRFVAVTGEETIDIKQSINYDGTAPIFYRAEFLAKNGYIDTNTAVLELTAADENSGMRMVQYAEYETAVTAAPKDLFQTAIVIPVLDEGPNTFWIRVGDLAGNYAPPMPVTVTLDTTPPVLGSITINGGALRTADNNLTMAVNTTDTSTLDMQISESSVFSGAPWLPYQSAASYVASNVNGVKNIYARTRDPLMRFSNVVTASIIFDTTPPADASVAFASAATSSPLVNVYLSANDNLSAWGTLEASLSGPGLVAVNGITTAVDTWINAAAVTSVTFSGDGPRSIGVRFRDEVLNTTSLAIGGIVVDTVAPIIEQAEFQTSAGYSNDAINILRLTASDDRTGLAYYQIADSVTNLTSAPLEAWRDTLFVPLAVQGPNVRWVRAIDAAGNYGSAVTAWVVYDTLPPVLAGVVLNGGNPRTNDNNFTAAIATTDVTVVELQLSESSVFSGAPWIPFDTAVSFTASAPNGVKTVFVRGRDSLNQFSNVVTASVIFDTMPPVDMSIAFVGAATSNAFTPIFLAANDNLSAWSTIEVQVTGATLAAVDGAPANVGAWLLASAVTGVTLAGDGFHMLTARFRDEVGNISSTASATVVLDTTPPEILEAVFDSAAGYTDQPIGILRLTASDDRSGLKYLQLADDLPGLDSAPLDPWIDTLFVPLGAPGLNTRYVRVVDAAGNYSAAISASVILDSLPPVLEDLELNAGAQFALSNMLAAATVVTDSSVIEMQVSESSVFSGASWIPYQTPVSFLVSATNGVKTVYARVRDPLGQVSNTIARAITLDTQAPYVAQAAFAQAVTNSQSPTLILTAVDNISAAGALQMRIQGAGLTAVNGNTGDLAVWLPYASPVTVTFAGTGVQTVAVDYRDEATNISPPAVASTDIDLAGPGSQVTLLSAEGNNRRAQLGWTAVSGAAYYVVEAMRGVSYGGTFTPTEDNLVVTGTGTVFTGLRNNADYTFRVRSYDAVGNADLTYSNMLTAAVGLVQRAVAWPGVTQDIIDFEVADGILHVMAKESSGNTVHMRSADNGATWSRSILGTAIFHETGAMAASPTALLATFPDSGAMEFRYSSDQGLSFSNYTLPFFDFTQYSYTPGLAIDGELAVFVGAQEVSTGLAQYYVTLAGNGGANTFGWSLPIELEPLGNATPSYYLHAGACVSGSRIRVLYQIENFPNRELRTAYSKDTGVTWTYEVLDNTAGVNFTDFQCQIDSRGSTYIMYRRGTENVLWVEQIEFNYEDGGSVVLPVGLPNGDTAEFVNTRMWVSAAGMLYYAAQDANTETLWLNSMYLGDGGWNDSANWNMRQVDKFPTAGSSILMDGDGLADVRVIYGIEAVNRNRLLTPYLPAPTSFRAALTNDNNVEATWSSLSSLSKFTVLTGTSSSFGASFNTDFDTVSYPNAGAYNAVATRDDYGPGESSVVYRNYPGYDTVFNTIPFPNTPKAAMSADPYDNKVYLAVANNTEVWVSRINSTTGTVTWNSIATMSSPVEGLDIDAVNGTVWLTYCNSASNEIFVRRSEDAGLTFGPAVDLNLYTPGLFGETCAIAGDIANDIVTVITDNTNDAWQLFQSTDMGDSFSTFEVAPTCEESGAYDADVAIDITNPQNQAIGIRNGSLGDDCNAVYVTDDNWSTSTQFSGLGDGEPRVGVYDGMVYGLGANFSATTFAFGSVSGSGWTAEIDMDVGADSVAGIAYGAGQYAAAYVTAIGLQLATCTNHCTSPSAWAKGVVLDATATDRAVMSMDMDGNISYGVFGAGAPEVRHWANQGSYTELPFVP